MRKISRLIFLIICILLFIPNIHADQKAYILHCDGIINSIMSSYLTHNIKQVEKKNDGFIIITIDTPGGLLESTREIVLTIMNSSVPIIGYVHPEGARAASAGAFILLSCDKTAMAPTANVGAAHPVNLGKKMGKTMEQKILNDTVAFITGIARKRGKNIQIAKKMVTHSVSITSKEALKKNIADYNASSIDTLLKNLHNKKIKKESSLFKLKTKSIIKINRSMNIFEKLLFKISHPNIAYILLILGIYGIMAEFSSPGVGFPGVAGGICLILAFFSLNTLPINLAGLLLIVLALILFILELNTSSGGVLGIGSVISLILGSIMLIRSSASFLSISPMLIITFGLFSIIMTVLIVFFGVKIQFKKPKLGQKGIIGETGKAKTNIQPRGTVFIQGELWQAKAYNNQQIKKDDSIEVMDIKNLLLIVKKIK